MTNGAILNYTSRGRQRAVRGVLWGMEITGSGSHGWYRHSTLSLTVVGCHPLGIHTAILSL
jgi:hypothetical protein